MVQAVVFEKHRRQIYGHILRLVHSPEEAEDLTQETFLRAHTNSATLQNPEAEAAWLYRIATNLCYDHFRRPAYKALKATLPPVKDEFSETGLPADETQLDQIMEQAEMRACIQEFVQNLPPGYGRIIFLHDFSGFSGPEIASLLGCSLETVKIRLHRARRKLKEALLQGCHFSHDERGVLVCDRKACLDLSQIQSAPLP